MKPQSNLFRIFAVGLALLLVGAYVFDRSGGDLKAAVGLDRVFGRDAQVEALNQRIDRLEGKLDLLLNASGIHVTTSSDFVGDPFAGSPPTAAPTPPTAAPAPTYLHSTKSAAVFEPSPVQPTVSTGTPRTATPELMLGPKSAPVFTPVSPTPPTAGPTNTGAAYPPPAPSPVYQNQEAPPPRANAPNNPPPPVKAKMLPGSKSMRVFTPETFTGPPAPPAQQVQQQKGHPSLR